MTGWPRHFGPVSGSDPKIDDPVGRYVLLTFTYGANLGPYQVARHMPGVVTAHQLATAVKHAGVERIDAAKTDGVNAFAQLDLPKVWGEGRYAAADGSQVDTWSDNLLAESHIRYGGFGGIAYRHIADTYIALFSRFIPCGVWEAVYILDGLLQNRSDIQPDKIHADTQGQSLPVFGLAQLLGFELLPRIRNWHDLVFYRPTKTTRYAHIDTLFDDAAIDWRLIETHWPDLMRVVLSLRAGRISSVALLRRLGHDSRKNKLYRAFRELGRAVRTIVLLRYLSDPALRDSIAVITNRMEAFHSFAQWLSFGGDVLADNDPDHQDKLIKLNELMANCVIYNTTLDITDVVNDLVAPATINTVLAAVGDFYARRGLGAPDVRRLDLPRHAPRALKPRDATRWQRSVERWLNPRDRVLALIPFYAGLRIGEAIALDLDDVRRSARKGILIVRSGKGNRYREVPIHADLREHLDVWIDDERPHWKNAETNPALLLNTRGGRLSARGARDIITAIGEHANLGPEFSSHVLRHTFGTTMIREKHDIVVVAELLGHARLETTRSYSLPTAEDRERAVNSIPSDH